MSVNCTFTPPTIQEVIDAPANLVAPCPAPPQIPAPPVGDSGCPGCFGPGGVDGLPGPAGEPGPDGAPGSPGTPGANINPPCITSINTYTFALYNFTYNVDTVYPDCFSQANYLSGIGVLNAIIVLATCPCSAFKVYDCGTCQEILAVSTFCYEFCYFDFDSVPPSSYQSFSLHSTLDLACPNCKNMGL